MSAGDIEVRVATGGDADLLAPLFAAHRGADEFDEKVERYRERLGSLVTHPAHRIVVAEQAGEVVGYAAAQDYGAAPGRDWSVARMHDLWVRPDARGHGAGRALFGAIRAWAEQHTRVRVLEWQSLDVAAGFYQHLGLAHGKVDEVDGRETYELAVHLPGVEQRSS